VVEAVERHTGGPPLMAWWLGAQPFRGGRGRGRVGRRQLSAWRTRGEGEEAREGEEAAGVGGRPRPGERGGRLEVEGDPDGWAL
jgi:hypothetical protein